MDFQGIFADLRPVCLTELRYGKTLRDTVSLCYIGGQDSIVPAIYIHAAI
jgi:hypothetical protein